MAGHTDGTLAMGAVQAGQDTSIPAPGAAVEPMLLSLVRARVIDRARTDPVVFAQYVFRHKDGRPWKIGRHHREWHRLWSDSSRVVILAPFKHGKTQQALARLLWEFGQPGGLNKCFAIVSATATQAEKISRSMMDHIERNPRLREVFPHLRPGNPGRNPNEKWGASAWTLAGRAPGINDPTVQALGYDGAIQGARLDGALIDDVHDVKNSSTKEGRAKVLGNLRAQAFSRCEDGGFLWVLGTTWAKDDVPHVLINEGWAHPDRPFQQCVQADGSLLWPEWITLEWVATMKRTLGTWEWERQGQNNPRDDATSIVKLDWMKNAMKAGSVPRLSVPAGVCLELPRECWPPGAGLFVGVDLAFTRRKTSNLTALVPILVMPPPSRIRRLLHVIAGQFSVDQMIRWVEWCRDVYGQPIFVVENNAAQELMCQTMRWLSAATVVPHHTGRGEQSLDFSMTTWAVEVEQGQWEFPGTASGEPATAEVAAFQDEALDWNPDGHTGDRLAATLFVRDKCDLRMGRVETTGGSIIRR